MTKPFDELDKLISITCNQATSITSDKFLRRKAFNTNSLIRKTKNILYLLEISFLFNFREQLEILYESGRNC